MAHRTVFAHHKGGTGKTTACVNIAGFLSKNNEQVLVVDADPQANATYNLGHTTDHLDQTLYDLLMDAAGLYDGYSEVTPRQCVYPTAYGVDIIPGDQQLHDAYNMLWETDGRNEVLSTALQGVEGRYDHVLIDTPSSQLNAIAAGIRAAHSFYLVMDSSIFSHEGTEALRSFLKRLPDRHEVMMNPDRVLFTQHKQRSFLDDLKHKILPKDYAIRSERLARSLFGTRFTTIPYSDDILKSQKEQIPLSHMKKTPATAQVFEDVAEDMMDYSW